MTLATPATRLLRNTAIAIIIALTITLAPIVRADTVRFVRTVFSADQRTAIVKADVTQQQR
jgi:hypothetical protein